MRDAQRMRILSHVEVQWYILIALVHSVHPGAEINVPFNLDVHAVGRGLCFHRPPMGFQQSLLQFGC